MEKIIKSTREVGTSAGVLLPRRWLNRQVVVTLLEKSKEDIAKDIFSILVEKKINSDVLGIYLTGSYARGDNDPESDIDVLVISQKTNKLLTVDDYEIIIISELSLKKNLSNSLYYNSMISEAETFLNKSLLDNILLNKPKYDFQEQINEIKRMVKINSESVEFYEKLKENVLDGIIYSIILRLRELYIIKCLTNHEKYKKRDFLKNLTDNSYKAYLRIKRDEPEINNTSVIDAKKLIQLTKKWLKDLKE